MSSEAKISVSVDGAAVAQAAFQGIQQAVEHTGNAAASAKPKLDQMARSMADAGRMSDVSRQAVTALEQPTSHVAGFLGDMGKQITATAVGFVSAQAVLGVVGGGFRALSGFVQDSAKAYADADAAQIKLTAALRQQGSLTPSVTASLNDMASAFQATTVHSDDTINSMQALLAEIGGVMPSAMKGALQAAADLSAGLGIELDAATRLVAKAAAGHTEQLGRYGIVVDQAAVKTKGFDAVLGAINQKFGGQAAAEVETYSGKVKQLENSWNNFQEAVGKFVLMNPFTTAALRSITEAAAALDEKSGETTYSVAGLVRALGLPISPTVIAALEAYTAESNRAADATSRLARLKKEMTLAPSHVTEDEKRQRELAAATEAARLASERQAKALDVARKAAEELRKELPQSTAAARALESGFAGLQTTVGLLDDSEQEMLGSLTAYRKALDTLEGSVEIANFGFTRMAEGLDKIGKKNDDIRDLVRSLQRMVDVERTMPAGFYQTGVALDTLGRKSTEIDDLRIRIAGAKSGTTDWSGALTSLTNDFVQLAQISGGTLNTFIQQAAEGIKVVEVLARVTKQINLPASQGGGMTAANFTSLAAGWASIYGAMMTYTVNTYRAQAAQKKLDEEMVIANQLALDFSGTLQENRGTSALTKQIQDIIQFSPQLNAQLEGLLDTVNKIFPNEPRDDRGAGGLNMLRAEALAATDIIRELGGVSQLTAHQLDMIKSTSVPALLEMINKGGPIAVQAMSQLTALFGEFVPSLDDITAAADRYGLKLDELGPKVKQMSIDKLATQIAKDFEMLVGAGVPFETLMRDIITRTTETGANFDQMSKEAQDAYLKAGGIVTETTTGMHQQIQDVVKDALRLGGTLPETMKPVIQALVDSGKLVDENGNALEDLSRFNFAKPLEKMIEGLIEALDRLIGKFGDVQGAASNMPGPPGSGAPGASASAYVSPGYDGAARSSLARGATVIPFAAARGGAGVTVNIQAIQAWDGASVAAWLRNGGGAQITQHIARTLPSELRKMGAI